MPLAMQPVANYNVDDVWTGSSIFLLLQELEMRPSAEAFPTEGIRLAFR